MKPSEFCYWLQGYFELRRDDTPLTIEQWNVVINHINLVKRVAAPDLFASILGPAESQDSLLAFINWLCGILEAAGTPELRVDVAAITPLVKAKLAEQFKHVIDKSYGIDPAELHKVHSPATKKAEDGVEAVKAERKKLKDKPYSPSDHYPPTGGAGGTSYNC